MFKKRWVRIIIFLFILIFTVQIAPHSQIDYEKCDCHDEKSENYLMPSKDQLNLMVIRSQNRKTLQQSTLALNYQSFVGFHISFLDKSYKVSFNKRRSYDFREKIKNIQSSHFNGSKYKRYPLLI